MAQAWVSCCFALKCNAAPFAFDWQWAPEQGAEYFLKAVAMDDEGNYGTSDVVRVTAGFDLPPTIVVASPANNTVVRYDDTAAELLVSAVATDAAAVVNVEFFVNVEAFGTVAQEPFELVWPRRPAGVYSFHVIATDDIGSRLARARTSWKF